MEYRPLGKSDIRVSAVTFGAWAIGGWMWGPQDDTDAVAAIRKSIDLGVTTIDTAAVYGFGHSEELVAQAIADRPREEIQILTKFGLRWDTPEGSEPWQTTDGQGRPITVIRNSRRASILHECEQSLRRLRTDYIDLYQCHRRDESTPLDETADALARLLKDGKIRAAGVSNFTVVEVAAMAEMIPLASVQPPYSMVTRDIEADLLPHCREHDIAVLVYSPLQRGLLTGKIRPGHKFAEGDHRGSSPYFSPDNIQRVVSFLDKIRPIAAGHRATLAQLVINWTILRPGVTVALVGGRNALQAEENAKAGEFRLTEAETQEINDLLEDLKLEV